MSDLERIEKKLDKANLLLDEWYESRFKIKPGPVLFDLAFGSIIGYFLYKILDHHIG